MPIETNAQVSFDKDGEEVEVPFARVGTTPRVIRILTMYPLTWHDGAIPSDEVWVNFSGDHGKSIMKFCVHFNVNKPNSKKNKFVVRFEDLRDRK